MSEPFFRALTASNAEFALLGLLVRIVRAFEAAAFAVITAGAWRNLVRLFEFALSSLLRSACADFTDERFATKAERHKRSLELIRIFDEIFASKDLAEWRRILDGNGLVFGVIGILDDIPHDRQMMENEVLIPFEGDGPLTVNSPIWIDGSQKKQPRLPPELGEHSDEILRQAGYDEAAIAQLRGSGAVA